MGSKAALCLLAAALPCGAATWIVSPTGTSGGAGTVEDPLSLSKAIGQTSPAGPGDIIQLRGNSIGYTGAVSCYLTGAVAQPITITNYPSERALLVGTNISAHVFTVVEGSSNVWIRGLHIINANTNRVPERGHGIYILGPGTKVLHCIIHDTGNGIGAWSQAPDTELAGNIIYFNGYQDVSPDRGHGHGIYMQNLTGAKLVRNNIIFNQFGKGIQAYAQDGDLRHMIVSNNICFNNGGASRDLEPDDNILVGGSQPAIDIKVINNIAFTSLSGGINIRFGYNNMGSDRINDALVFANNYVARGGANYFQWWTNAIVTNNVFKNNQASLVFKDDGTAKEVYDWNRNYYYSGGSWVVNVTNTYSFSQWKLATGFDANSTQASEASAPATVVHVFADPYISGRAQISIINWASNDVVAVDFSSVLSVGQSYTLKNAQYYFGSAVLTGTYAGGTVNVPMTNLTATLPLGVTNIPPTSWPVMNAFVLTGDAIPSGVVTANIGTLNLR